MGKKSNPRAVPSAANGLSTTSLTKTQSRHSAVIKHAFSPSKLQLNLFASVVQGHPQQVLRIHDTRSGALTSEHVLHSGRVSCLSWGRYFGANGESDRPTKKRKTQSGAPDAQQGDAVVAIGFANESRIDLYSPGHGKVIVSLDGPTGQGTRCFRFVEGPSRKAWSLGGDGKLVQWDLEDGSHLDPIILPSQISSSTILHDVSGTIFAAHSSIFAFDPTSPSDYTEQASLASPIHSLMFDASKGSARSILAACEDSNNVVVFDLGHQDGKAGIRGNLIASAPIESLAAPDDSVTASSALATVDERGLLEIFDQPFIFNQTAGKKTAKQAAQGRTRRPTGTIQVTRPDSSQSVPISAVTFDEDDLIIGWFEGGTNPVFHREPWRNGLGVIVQGDRTIQRAKQGSLTNGKSNGVTVINGQVDDTHTVIVRGGEDVDAMSVDGQDAIVISSAEEESSEDSDEDDEKNGDATNALALSNGVHESDEEMDDASEREDEEDEADAADVEEPTFGDQLRAKTTGPVDVAAAFSSKAQTALVPQGEKTLSLPSGMSLGTVLAQSLRTNDRELLETCFHVQDLQIVRATIERLDGTLAGALLDKLAERLHNRPGRAGSLMVWIQWTLVAHGGYLASQPKVVKQLRQLQGVVKERAQALQPLLLLKGKLDMLEAQMRLRKNMVQRSRALQVAREEEEEDAIYVDGEEEESSGSEMQSRQLAGGATADVEDIDFDSDDDDELAPNQMNVDEEDEDADEDQDEDGDLGLIDDEAEDTEDDSGMDDEIDHDDVDSGDDAESDSEGDEIPAKVSSRLKMNGVVEKR